MISLSTWGNSGKSRCYRNIILSSSLDNEIIKIREKLPDYKQYAFEEFVTPVSEKISL